MTTIAKNAPTATAVQVSLDVASHAASRIFNHLLKSGVEMSFGLGFVEVREYGALKMVNLDHCLMVSALNLITSNGGTSEPWLAQSLRKSERDPSLSMDVIKAVHDCLINAGVINRRSSVRRSRNSRGQLVEQKIWELALEYQILVEKFNIEPEAKIVARTGDMPSQVDKIVKGDSGYTQRVMDCVAKLDQLKLKFNPLAEDIISVVELNNPSKDDQREIDAIRKFRDSMEGEVFQLSHRLDYRGRGYALGGMISYQGSKTLKACIQFAERYFDSDGNSTNMDEVWIYVARLHGFKGNWKAARNHGKQIVDEDRITVMEAHAVLADPARAVIRIDGSANGIQHICGFMGHLLGCELTNLIGTAPRDMYSEVGEAIGLNSRDEAKQVIMPTVYGASQFKLEGDLGFSLDEPFAEMDKILPIRYFLQYVKSFAAKTKAERYQWTLPDGFRVDYTKEAWDTVGGGKSFEVKIDGTKRTDYDGMRRALAPNIIHSLDAYMMRLIIEKADFPVVPIHDSFGCHSVNMPKLRKIAVETFAQLFSEDCLRNIFKELGFWPSESMKRLGAKEFPAPIDPALVTNQYMFM